MHKKKDKVGEHVNVHAINQALRFQGLEVWNNRLLASSYEVVPTSSNVMVALLLSCWPVLSCLAW